MNYFQKLIDSGVVLACRKMGIDLDSEFVPSESDDDKYYCVHSHNSEGLTAGIVIHAIPPLDRLAVDVWEEWYVMDGVLHHVFLTAEPGELTDKEVYIEPDDKNHPIHVLGQKWYYYEILNYEG